MPNAVASLGVGGADLIRNGLVSQYRFNDGSGTNLTDYVSGYNGTLGTGGSDQPDWVTQGLDFVPANADVVVNTTMPDSVLTGSSGFTISIVCQIDTGSAFRHFVGKHAGNGATQCPIDFRTNSSATPVIQASRSNTGINTFTGPNGTLSAYRMYSVTFPDNLVESIPTFYVGATPTAGTKSGTATGAVTGSSANLRIGRRADGAVQMDGIIGYVLIYNRALSGGEISQNYNVLKGRLALRGISLP